MRGGWLWLPWFLVSAGTAAGQTGATAVTAIGGQHVTLETERRGQGDVTRSFAALADAALVFPTALSGDFVVTQIPSRTVIAEVHKVAGSPMNLALPSGRYSVRMAERPSLPGCRGSVQLSGWTALRPSDARL